MYIENPKTKGSGILCAIPQQGTCPVGCKDCFFQSGRSYLEPLDVNLPNLPSHFQANIYAGGSVVRINDGNDSNNQRDLVIATANRYKNVFFNTSMPKDLAGFMHPVVLTINPGNLTDIRFHKVSPIPKNLMFVRFRVNTWNLDLCDEAIEFYTSQNVPVVLTFMAYYTEQIPEGYAEDYSFRKRTMNSYYVINSDKWDEIMKRYTKNNLVYSCGKDAGTFSCARCGNCIREYFVTKERSYTDCTEELV